MTHDNIRVPIKTLWYLKNSADVYYDTNSKGDPKKSQLICLILIITHYKSKWYTYLYNILLKKRPYLNKTRKHYFQYR